MILIYDIQKEEISDFWVKEQFPYDKWGNSLLRIYLITNGNNGNKIIFMHILYFQFNSTIKKKTLWIYYLMCNCFM